MLLVNKKTHVAALMVIAQVFWRFLKKDTGLRTGSHMQYCRWKPLISYKVKQDICKLLFNICENRHAYILIFVEVRCFEGGVPSNRPPAANQFAPMKKAI